MNPLRRLGDDGDPFERDLLRSARADRMSDEAKREIVAALGSGAAVPSALRPPGADLTRAGAAGSSMGVASKWVFWALFGSAGVAASALVITRHGQRPVPAVSMPSAVLDETNPPASPESQEAPTPPPSVPSVPASEASATSATSASEPARGSGPARSLAGATSSIATAVPDASGTTTSLAAELGLVERARASLRAGRPLDALRVLDEHRSRFAHGALEEEMAVLRIEAYRLAGDTATTSTLAHEFLAAHPRDPYTPRVQRVLTALSPQGAR